MGSCIFCTLRDAKVAILESEDMFAIPDKFPVSKGHTLIIPKRHCLDFFELQPHELEQARQLLLKRRESLVADDGRIAGFNVAANCGAAAGQTVFHCHIHLIPRRQGDVADPEGGVRNIL